MSELFKNALRPESQIVLTGASIENGIDSIPLSEVVVNKRDEDVPIKKIESDWTETSKNLSTIIDEEVLTLINCPSIDSALSNFSHFINEFFTKVESSISLRIKVDEMQLTINEHQTYELVPHLKKLTKSFLISFESTIDNSCIFYWKLKDGLQFLKLTVEANECDVGEFVSDFIVKSLKSNHNALHSTIKFPTSRLICDTSLDMMSNAQNFNLLFEAASFGSSDTVKLLLDYFDVNQMIGNKTAVDLAFEAKNFETVLVLLQANSKFPHGFKEKLSELPLELRKFSITSTTMHNAITSNDQMTVTHVLQQNPGLKYFFNLDNQSALAVALEKRAFGIYKILIDKNISLGPHESFEDIMEGLSSAERRALSNINIKSCKNLKEGYILKLLANCNVGPDDALKETRFAHVVKAFVCLNKIEEIKILLKFTAAMENFQLVFDFKRDHVQFLDPKSESYMNGLFYTSGRIYVGALHLLNDERAHEVYGVIAHEICHFVMFKTFDNHANPYAANDHKSAQTFKQISKDCELLQDFDEVISLVFTEYDEDQQHAELIVRIPHLLAHYSNNPEKLKEVREILSDFNRFYVTHCMKEIKEKLQKVEQELRDRSKVVKKSKVLKCFTCCTPWAIVSLLVLLFFDAMMLLGTSIKFHGRCKSSSEFPSYDFHGKVCKEKVVKCNSTYINLDDACGFLDAVDNFGDVCGYIICFLLLARLSICLRNKICIKSCI